MEKTLEIRFLEFLEPKEANPKIMDITSFMVINFQQPKVHINNEDDDSIIFLKRLVSKKYITVTNNPYEQISMGWEFYVQEEIHKRWWNTLTEPAKAIITELGLEHLHNTRVSDILLETSISNKDTNESTTKTNRLVRINIRVQIAMGIISTLAIGLTAIYAITAYYKPDSENLIMIRKSMQRQEQQSDSILRLQKERNTYLKSIATNTSSKKK